MNHPDRPFSRRSLFSLLRANRKGVALPMMAILAFSFLAFVALVTDGGLLLFHKRKMQAAADAAAWAGAQEVLRERREWGHVNHVTAGREDAKRNGFTNGVDSTVVTINRPPTSGDFQSNGFVEAVIEQPMPTFFVKGLYGKTSAMIRARAVAGLHGEGNLCIQALEPTAQRGIQISGTPLVDIDCVAWANSCNKNDSVSVDGSSTVNVKGIKYCEDGAFTGKANLVCSDDTTDCPAKATPLPDVLIGRGEPDYLNNGLGIDYTTPKQIDASNGDVIPHAIPGLYQAAAPGQPGIKITQGAQVHFDPGFYVVSGMSISGDEATTTVTGTDVTFFAIDSQLVSINGALVDFSAPANGFMTGTTGTDGKTVNMDNVFFWCQRGSTDKQPGHVFAGGGNSDVQGVFYCPDMDVTVTGNATTGGWMMLIVNQLKVTGTSTLASINPAPVGVIPELVEVNFVE